MKEETISVYTSDNASESLTATVYDDDPCLYIHGSLVDANNYIIQTKFNLIFNDLDLAEKLRRLADEVEKNKYK